VRVYSNRLSRWCRAGPHCARRSAIIFVQLVFFEQIMSREHAQRSATGFLAALAAIFLGLWTASTAWSQEHEIVPTPNIGHSEKVRLLTVSADGRYFASADDQTIRLWELSSGRLMRTLAPMPEISQASQEEDKEGSGSPNLEVLVITRDGGLVFAGDSAGRLHRWDAVTGRLLSTIQAHESGFNALVVTPDGETLISSSSDSGKFPGIASWSLHTMGRRAGRGGESWQLALAPDGTSVVVSSPERSERLVVPDLTVLNPLPAAVNAYRSRVSDDGRQIGVVKYQDRSIAWRIIDIATGQVIRTFEATREHDPLVAGPGSRLLVANRSPPPANKDANQYGEPLPSVEIWTPAGGNIDKVRLTRRFTPSATVFSNDGLILITADGNAIEVWDTQTGVLRKRLEGPSTIQTISISADGQRLLAVNASGTAFSWRTFTAELDRPPLVNSEPFAHGVIGPDGKSSLLIDSNDRLVVRGEGGALGRSLPDDWTVAGEWEWRATRDNFTPTFFGIVNENAGSVALWDPSKSTIAHQLALPANAGRVRQIAVATDSAWAFMLTERDSGVDGDFILWDLKKNQIDLRLERLSGKRIYSADFSPDRKWIVIGADDKISGSIVQIRSLADRKIVKQFRLEKGQSLGTLKFSPGGKYLLAFTGWTARRGRYVFQTSDWRRVEYRFNSKWFRHDYTFFANDTRVLETQGWSHLQEYILTTGFGPASRTLLKLATDGHNDLDSFGPPIAVDPRGERLVLADGANLHIVRASDGAQLGSLTGHLGDVTVARFFPDGNWLATGSKDGTVRLWNLRTNRLALTFIADQDGEWLALTAAGFYAGSDRPGRLMSVVRGQTVYSVEQFFGPLYRSDLVKELLAGDITGRYQDAASKLNLAAVLERGPAPSLELLDKTRAGDSMQLKIRVFNNGDGGIGRRLIWQVNGSTEGRVDPPELQTPPDPNGPVIVTESFKLDFGRENLITVTAFNGAREARLALASEPLKIRVERLGVTTGNEAPRPRMHVLAIGVNSYDTPQLDPLTLAVGDVQQLTAALRDVSRNGGYEPGLIIERVEKEANRERIADAFRELSGSVNRQDAFIMLLAGHGLAVDGRYFYYPITTKFGDGRDYETEGIPTETWQKWIAMVPADKKLIIVDTCQSKDAIAMVRGDNNINAQETVIDRLRHSTGHSVITAAREAAYESKNLKHGLLTYAILKALAIPRTDGKSIDVKTLDERIVPEVERLSLDLGRPPQRTYNKITDNFDIGLPLAAIAPPPVVAVKTLAGEYALRAETQVHELPSDNAALVDTLDAGTRVEVIEWFASWAKIAHKGSAVGYVPERSLLKLK
jgi:WD40 repeat protein